MGWSNWSVSLLQKAIKMSCNYSVLIINRKSWCNESHNWITELHGSVWLQKRKCLQIWDWIVRFFWELCVVFKPNWIWDYHSGLEFQTARNLSFNAKIDSNFYFIAKQNLHWNCACKIRLADWTQVSMFVFVKIMSALAWLQLTLFLIASDLFNKFQWKNSIKNVKCVVQLPLYHAIQNEMNWSQ